MYFGSIELYKRLCRRGGQRQRRLIPQSSATLLPHWFVVVPGPCSYRVCQSLPIQDTSISYYIIHLYASNHAVITRYPSKDISKSDCTDFQPHLRTQNPQRHRQDGFLRQPNHLCCPIQQPYFVRLAIVRSPSSTCIKSTTP